jgi:hypothetical protein
LQQKLKAYSEANTHYTIITKKGRRTVLFVITMQMSPMALIDAFSLNGFFSRNFWTMPNSKKGDSEQRDKPLDPGEFVRISSPYLSLICRS